MNSPNPEQIKLARENAGLTQAEAAALIYKDKSAWRRWETEKTLSSARDMDPALYELFMLKTGQLKIDKLISKKTD